ncbi:MAG: hypothetical protein ABL957_14780 [Parvularculaceae bacterium]
MFIGHYAPAVALKAVSKGPPLWHYFIAVQLLDYLWAIFILTGVEQARIVPGFLAASDLDLYNMPYTHSLAAALFWSLAAGAAYRLALNPRAGGGAAIAIACAVFSHWLADLLVHGKDLALYPGSEQKLGFALWESIPVSQTLEFGLLAAGGLLYIGATRPKGPVGRIAPFVVLAVLAAAQAFNLVGPPPPGIETPAVLALISYTAFAALAFWLDKTRAPR